MPDKENDSTTDTREFELYPCSCGHCTECGLNFVPTAQELREWAEEDDGITFVTDWRSL